MNPADGTTGRPGSETHWYEGEAGSLVRPYTVTRGRTRPVREHDFDLMTVVKAVPGTDPVGVLDHARSALLELLGHGPRPIAELAADADLPVGALRVLLGDLFDAGLVAVTRATRARPDPELLREVIDGLRRL